MHQLTHYFHSKTRYPALWGFTFIFYFSMGCSKYAQVLFFQQNGNLLNYSLSYSAMAISGSLSFIVSNRLVKWSLRKIILFFCPIYAVGMFLRVIPNSSLVAMLSGIIAGLGASVCLLVVRSWIYFESDSHPQDKNLLVSSRYSIMQLAIMIATIISGIFINWFDSQNRIYIIIIGLSSLLMLGISFMPNIPTGNVQRDSKKVIINLPENKATGIFYFGSVALLGLTSALVDPIVPAILRQSGFRVSQVTFWTTLFTIATVVTSLIYQSFSHSSKSNLKFILNQVIIGLTMVIVATFKIISATQLIVSFIIMSVCIAGFFIFKELMEYDMFPKNETFIYLALGQSGFLVGDAIGSPIGTTIYEQLGLNAVLLTFGILSLMCGFLYFGLQSFMKKNQLT